MEDINLNSLAGLVGDLNASEFLEGETLTLEPFCLETNGSCIGISFLGQNIWDNEDNRGDDDRNINDVKKHIKQELGHLLQTIRQIDLDRLIP